MAEMEFFVKAAWDPEARVMTVVDTNVPGLVAEADSDEALLEVLRSRIPELLELNSHLLDKGPDGFPVVFQTERRELFHAA